MLLRRLRPPCLQVHHSVAYSSIPRHDPHSPRNTVPKRNQPSRILVPSGRRHPSPEGQGQNTNAVSEALQQTEDRDNSLLSPVHIPEDPNGVLRETHPAADILANSAIVIQRRLELMNVMIGFEQANRYVIMDPQGNHIGYMAEQETGIANMLARQWFRTHRSFTTYVFDKYEREVLRFHRPFSWISSRVRVYDPLGPNSSSHTSSRALRGAASTPPVSQDNRSSTETSPLSLPDMRIIGEAQQQWAPLRRKYNLFLFRPTAERDLSSRPPSAADTPLTSPQKVQVLPGGDRGEFTQFAYVDEPFLSWDFSLLTADSKLMGSVNRNFSGFAREIFTDTGIYALRMDAAGLADEPKHLISKTGMTYPIAHDKSNPGMTLDQRAVMLATAVSVDFDYFSRLSTGGGVGFFPIWFPGGGEAVAEGAAAEGATAGGATGAGAVSNATKGGVAGAGGVGEGALAGGAALGGYEGLQRGVYGGGSSPAPDQVSSNPENPESNLDRSPPGYPGEGEEIWSDEPNLWGDSREDGQGGEDGEDGDWGDLF
ncbi:hypothetical protein GP486_000733 [Trichoglossum hirsutum]|uniref:Scramblase family protein n=1 Tax=Trichoglossum hirsutum TaxID=265104 RepID=A0A9P8RTD4_9PEZI|nr:hypothetical protein GP486_000733 [Trichoglossum hirsutum]